MAPKAPHDRDTKLLMCLVASSLISGCATEPTVDEKILIAADANRISTQLHSQRHLFESCRTAYGTERLDGQLTVRFKVLADGRAADPHIFESIGQSSALDHCLSEAALSLQFDPMPRGLVAEVEYPMEFKRTDRAPATLRKTVRYR